MKCDMINVQVLPKFLFHWIVLYIPSGHCLCLNSFCLFPALERLKEMLRRRDSQVSSTIIDATEDIAFASPCKASSTDDGNFKSHF